MAIVTTPLGFQEPDGTELVRGGDNVITANAAKAEELHQDARGRLTVIEAKNASQDTAIADARAYTDERDEAYRAVDRALWRAEDDSHQAAAEAYTDSRVGPADIVTNGDFRNGLTGWTNTGAWIVQTSANGVTSWARTMSGGDGSFAQTITVPARLLGKTLRLKVLAMTTSTGTLLTSVVTTAGPTSLTHALTTAYVERTLDVLIPAGQGTTPITLNVGRFSGTVYMTAIRLEAL